MTETSMPLIELLRKQDDGDFLRAVAEAVLQLLMEHDAEGVIGAGRHDHLSDGEVRVGSWVCRNARRFWLRPGFAPLRRFLADVD